MRRLAALLLAVLASAAVAVSDAKAVALQPVNAASYPRITSTVVVPTADGPAPQLTENGRPVQGYRALNLGSGKAIVLAVDRSRSMIGRPLQEASLASAAFVAAKDHQDQIAVHVFGWQPIALTGFSQATIDAETALRTLSVDDKTGTALYDEVVLAAESLRAQPQRGRVLVLLTDGREPDLGSLARLPSAIRAARRAGVIVYPIALGSANVVPLRQLAAATGGRLYASPSTASLGDVYRRIANELQRTWAVSYATTARPGDAIVVRAQGEGPTAERSLTLPGAIPSAAEPVLPSAVVDGRLGVLVLAGLAAALLGVAILLARRKPRSAVIEQMLELNSPGAVERRSHEERGSGLGGLFSATERAFAGVRHWQMLGTLLQRAALPLRPAELFYLSAGAGLAVGLVAAFLGLPPVATVIAFAAGFHAPIAFVWMRGRRRLRAFDDQLPDVLATIAASLRAGHSLKHGLQTIAEEASEPACSEFGRAFAEARFGRPLEDALEEMSQRLGSLDLEYVVTAIAVQAQVGGSLSDLFDLVAETVRNRQQHARKVRSLTAMGRMSAYVLVGLPFALALILNVLNPGLMSPLFQDPMGQMMIAYSFVSMAIGALLIKKIVAVKA